MFVANYDFFATIPTKIKSSKLGPEITTEYVCSRNKSPSAQIHKTLMAYTGDIWDIHFDWRKIKLNLNVLKTEKLGLF